MLVKLAHQQMQAEKPAFDLTEDGWRQRLLTNNLQHFSALHAATHSACTASRLAFHTVIRHNRLLHIMKTA